MEVKKLQALTEEEIAESVDDKNSDIDFVPKSTSESSDDSEEMLKSSYGLGQPEFSKRACHPTILPGNVTF
jgi:hypothetical protein